MKIEVGEYVRTKQGEIYKIEDGTEFYEDSVDVGIGIIPDVDGIWVDKEHFIYIEKKDIVTHSKNIIDLIEVGDYVNGDEIVEIEQDAFIKGQINLWTNIELRGVYGDYERLKYTNEDIETIVTKEQFENIKYEV